MRHLLTCSLSASLLFVTGAIVRADDGSPSSIKEGSSTASPKLPDSYEEGGGGGCSKECKEFIRKEIKKLRNELEPRIRMLETKVRALESRVKSLDDTDPEIGRVTKLDHPTEGIVAKLNARVTALSIPLNNLQRIVGNVTQPSEIKDYERLEVLGNMIKSPSLRDEIYRDAKYRLRIHNRPCKSDRLQVNGVYWRVIPTHYSYVPVPRGPITVMKRGAKQHVVGYDKKIQWKPDRLGFYIDYDIERDKFVNNK